MRRAIATLLALVLFATAGATHADPTPADLATARKTFDEGIKHEEAGDWPSALAAFRKVAAVKTNHIVRFHVALCLEKTGKLVDALNEFALAKVQAEKEGGVDAELTIASSTKHIEALRARIPSLRVKRPTNAPESRVTVDGRPSLFDVAIPLDPGSHRVEVLAPARKPFARDVELVEGATEPVDLEPLLVDDAAPKGAPKPMAKTVAAERETHALPIVVGSVGAVALVGATVAWTLRASTLAELDASCNADREMCDPSKRHLDARGSTYTIAGNVLAGVGVVALGAAIVLYTVEPSRSKTPTTQVTLGLGSVGLISTF